MPYFVQFPHPGREHRPRPPAIGTVMDFNVGDHKRKFLRADGAYLVDGRREEGAFCFWGEWEAPSRVLDMWPKDGALPRFLHEPIYRPPTGPKYQNTDPFVFGERFLYTNCKQLSIGWLRQLPAGSLVVFGSGTSEGFILDTVFVVGDPAPRPYEMGELRVVPENPASDAIVFDPLRTTRHVGAGCVAYQGRMHSDGDQAPYSFVPCRPADDDQRFARPLIEPTGPLRDLIEPKLFMGARRRELSDGEVAESWQHMVDLCRANGLVQGVFTRPPHIGTPVLAGAQDVRQGEGLSC